MQKGINNVHDKFFKRYMSEPSVAKDFLKTFLPKKLLQEIDIESLKMSKDSYISSELTETFSDIIFDFKNSKIKDGQSYKISILLEHKSYIDKNIYLQLLQYIVNGHLSQEKSKVPLQPIITVILYHGRDVWIPKKMIDLFDNIPKAIKQYIPKFDAVFIDLSKFSDHELQSIGNYFLSSALLLQKYSRTPEDLLLKVNKIFSTLESVSSRNLIKPIIVYFLNVTQLKIEEMEKIIDKIPSSLKIEVMSTYENIFSAGEQKGEEKGLQKGLQKVIISGYAQGFSIEDLSKLTGLSEKKVQEIINDSK